MATFVLVPGGWHGSWSFEAVVPLLEHAGRARVTSATLVGHSYGGMVIAAADRADGRIARLVHLDAYVPRDGESCWSSTTEHYREAFAAGFPCACGTGTVTPAVAAARCTA
ncbi:hypothetical protein AB0I77_12795 [Streptomyces sp. NPDC050619]|uniref:alpha/beta fold hydrolase n=1 Tax=Streptomyces sp. NPDC050619 TaxID=3157214 RepID=UPI00343BED94